MTDDTCVHADGCDRATFSRRLCRPHYMREYKAGELDRYPRVRRLPEVRRCRGCGGSFSAEPAVRTQHCSRACLAGTLRGPLRLAWESQDWQGFIAQVRSRCAETDAGCWEWQGKRGRDGYPRVLLASRPAALHRLMLEAREGAPLGSQQAHHVCANRACVNPQHLQPVTNAANAAEMGARRSYVGRIAELEAALALLDPGHPLLRQIPTA